jgi:aminomethyltransferase
MPDPTPFHPRLAELCHSQEWRNWAGYLSPATYQHSYDPEYFAIRNAAGLIDVSPLFKYDVTGPDALRLVNRIATRDMSRCAVGQIFYSPWCDDDGKVIDDGTFWRLEPQRFRVTAADPNLRWFLDCSAGLEVQVQDVSEAIAAVAVQGPNARAILQRATSGADLEALPYYHLASAAAGRIPVTITRTGYTGDLGYELWVEAAQAPALWDALMRAGQPLGLTPTGLAALDIARIEAGLLLIEVDYISSLRALTEARKSTPYEIGLGWAVDLDEPTFVGRHALALEHARGAAWGFVGLEVGWTELESLFAKADLPPQVAGRAARDAVPIFHEGRQVGQATSRTFSPLLKKYLALGSVERPLARLGTQLELEITVEFSRRRVPATVVRRPFFDPPRKRS